VISNHSLTSIIFRNVGSEFRKQQVELLGELVPPFSFRSSPGSRSPGFTLMGYYAMAGISRFHNPFQKLIKTKTNALSEIS
jgi:hypothetical protein